MKNPIKPTDDYIEVTTALTQAMLGTGHGKRDLDEIHAKAAAEMLVCEIELLGYSIVHVPSCSLVACPSNDNRLIEPPAI